MCAGVEKNRGYQEESSGDYESAVAQQGAQGRENAYLETARGGRQ